jgi:hypothetical protein
MLFGPFPFLGADVAVAVAVDQCPGLPVVIDGMLTGFCRTGQASTGAYHENYEAPEPGEQPSDRYFEPGDE